MLTIDRYVECSALTQKGLKNVFDEVSLFPQPGFRHPNTNTQLGNCGRSGASPNQEDKEVCSALDGKLATLLFSRIYGRPLMQYNYIARDVQHLTVQFHIVNLKNHRKISVPLFSGTFFSSISLIFARSPLSAN